MPRRARVGDARRARSRARPARGRRPRVRGRDERRDRPAQGGHVAVSRRPAAMGTRATSAMTAADQERARERVRRRPPHLVGQVGVQAAVVGPVAGRGVLRAEGGPQVGQPVARRAGALGRSRRRAAAWPASESAELSTSDRPRPLGGGLLGEQVGREDRRQDQEAEHDPAWRAPIVQPPWIASEPEPGEGVAGEAGERQREPAPISTCGASVQPMYADGTSASAARPPAIRITPAAAEPAERSRGRSGGGASRALRRGSP